MKLVSLCELINALPSIRTNENDEYQLFIGIKTKTWWRTLYVFLHKNKYSQQNLKSSTRPSSRKCKSVAD